MMDYRRHPLTELSDKQLDDVMKYTHEFDGGSQSRIYNRFVQKHKKQRLKRVPVILTACFLIISMFLVGFTNYDRIGYLIYQTFGDNSLSQYAVSIRNTYTNNGIKMEIVSGLRDSSHTYLFVDVTDINNDRLDDRIWLRNWSLKGTETGGGGVSLLGYDAATKTATFMFEIIGGQAGDLGILEIDTILYGENRFSYDLTDISIEDLLEDSNNDFISYDHKQGLSIGYNTNTNSSGISIDSILPRNRIKVDSQYFNRAHISNIGYRNGLLHIQIDHKYDLNDEALYLSLYNESTGTEIEYLYSTNYYGNGSNIEYVFQVDLAEVPNLNLRATGWYFSNRISGTWKTSVVIPTEMEERNIDVPTPIEIGDSGEYIYGLTLSPMSLNIQLSTKDVSDLAVEVFYMDGSVLELPIVENYLQQDVHESKHILMRYPIPDFDKITSISINNQQIQISQN